MLVNPKLVDPDPVIQRVLGIMAAAGVRTPVHQSKLPEWGDIHTMLKLIKPKQIGRGMYVIKHFSFNHFLPESKNRYERQYPSLPEGMENYGVCDTPEQFLSSFGDLLERDPKGFVVSFTHVSKDAQPPEGGWRWEKWGPYVGKGRPSREYLVDESGFSSGVYCYHIYGLANGEYEGS